MSRRQNRRLRRILKRDKNKITVSYDDVISYKSLYRSAFVSAKGVKWKASVQKYRLNLFSNLYKTRRKLLAKQNVCEGFIEFDISERGKIRHIKSVHFNERVIQKSLCQNALIPTMTRNLIVDNGASQKGKGTHYSLKRLEKQLRKHYRKYGYNGYILLVDFKKYFDNINHEKLKTITREYLKDVDLVNLYNGFIDAFGVCGLGLGSETSQISAVVYLNKIDHYIKEQAKIKGYGKYMDDSYFIHRDKEYLKSLLRKLQILFLEYGIKLNEKKTIIVPLKQGFTFLKTRFFLTDNGKIIKKPCHDSIVRERRKLKRQAFLLRKGVLTEKEIKTSFVSWCGSMKSRQARKTVHKMKELCRQVIGGKTNG